MKKLRYAFILLAGLFFYSILLAASVRNIYLSSDNGERRLGFMAKPLKFLAETTTLIYKAVQPDEFLVENLDLVDGFTFYKEQVSSTYPKLLVGYKTAKFESKFELLDMNTGDVLKQWSPDNKLLFEKAYNPLNPRRPPSKGSDLHFMHPLMTKDSSLMFTSQLTSLLAKIDKHGELKWLKNDKTYHHSLEMGDDNKIYSCTRPFQSGKYDFLPGSYEDYKNTLMDDHITIINSDTKEELFDKSVLEILVENGYEDLVLYKGQVIGDPLHLNDIQPALYSTEHWQKDDLLISCRNISTVFLYRPETNKIIWLKHGPWYNQHDVDFHGQNQVVVFGNDVIREESKINGRITNTNLSFSNKRPHNQVYLYDLAKDSVTTPFHALMKSEMPRTITSGRCDILENGDLFVEETNQGRIFIGDSTSKKIDYVKRLDEKYISSLFWSRIVN
ncbi:arylsulfotransferase family protein [Ulvibacterium marinum]|uniref:arylsulfotransferase family protein n=1 Tax=Ulvibacterium marinum TaxID=2419782 RepID=UPI002495A546|nr:arylsulfotransferase family protein [Ulvibacterium marinum]